MKEAQRSVDCQRHQSEIQHNLLVWRKKRVLRAVYRDMHSRMAVHLSDLPNGITVELGSGIGNIKDVIPGCIKTDLFNNPWIDQVEDAYHLSFPSLSVANLLLMDVFHHLQYPGNALCEFHRVLLPGGRLIILEPCVSFLGLAVYGAFHREPLGLYRDIQWYSKTNDDLERQSYYAAQGNAYRIFRHHRFRSHLGGWRQIEKKRMAAFAYVLSGGYSKPQLFPEGALPLITKIEKLLNKAPLLFATRLLVVLEKRDA